MKKKISLMAVFCLTAVFSFGQISTKQLPRSFKTDININDVATINIPAPDMQVIEKMDAGRDSLFKMRACAALLPVNKDFFDKATKYKAFGGYLYLLRIKAEGALALNYYSDNFNIPKGSELYIWNPDYTKCLGAYTSDNNSEDGYFAIDYVYGDEMIMEYYQPYAISSQAKLNIEKIGYFYRDVINFEDLAKDADNNQDKSSDEYRASGTCNVNVNCSEGDNFRNEQNSVVRLYIPFSSYQAGWCSGTLLNNTSKDKTPYIMSAAHCIQDMTASKRKKYHSQTIVYFNYQTSGCSTPNSEPGYNSMTGLTYLVHDANYGMQGGDYWLAKIKSSIPESYNPYWSGWTRRAVASKSGVGIHHPAGDVKKISTYKSQITGESYSSTQWTSATHWFVEWSPTANGFGITEGGSSGSGLWDSLNYYVGMLSGGISDCSQNSEYQFDWYGKFHVAFNYCKSWLDPNNTDSNSIKGRSYNQDNDIKDVNAQSLSFNIYPNPTTDKLNIDIVNINGDAVISVLDNLGRTLYDDKISAAQKHKIIDVSNLAKGTYYVRLYQNSDSIIRQFIKQ